MQQVQPSPKFIHLVGDSTLDNLYWVDEHDSVANQLSTKCRYNRRVNDLAFDGFTTHDVLEGGFPGAVLPNGDQKRKYMLERRQGGERVFPLQSLKNNIKEGDFVVLSVGGNDFRVNLLKPWKLVKDIPQIQQRYLQIVKTITDMGVKPILMLQYRTDAKHDDTYCIYTIFKALATVAIAVHCLSIVTLTASLAMLAAKVSALAVSGLLLGALGLYLGTRIAPLSIVKDAFLGKNISMVLIGKLMESFYRPILEHAEQEHLPVLDLPNTFNPYEPLYKSGIEPNANGAALIAEGIAHIVENHDFSGGSRVYHKGEEFFIPSLNDPSDWRVTYVHPPVMRTAPAL